MLKNQRVVLSTYQASNLCEQFKLLRYLGTTVGAWTQVDPRQHLDLSNRGNKNIMPTVVGPFVMTGYLQSSSSY